MTAQTKPNVETAAQRAYDGILRDKEIILRSELQRIVDLRQRGFEGNSFDEESR